MFKTYLKGSASMWYKSLKPRSIGSYEQLKRKFPKYHSHLCQKKKDTEALVHCRQRANEELGDYLARFKEEDRMVTNLDMVKAMGFLTAGMDPYKGKKLCSSLYNSPPLKSLNDIYVRGENIQRKMESIGGYKHSRRDDHSKRTERYESSRSGVDRRDSRKEERKETNREVEHRQDTDSAVFTPLNAPISKILHKIKGKPRFVHPAKMKVPNHKKNLDKYCDYHRDKGHNTDECYHLKKLIGQNKIWKFEGTITLPVLLGKLPYIVEKPVKFYVVRIESPDNALLGRPFFSTIEEV
ncbi:uncharacterized protein LOC141708422 [Apium graveolens]|uniref:uncharacterized protein LOC141708422 n=1 Tax=Apium graveolens TaxID=4045 RepID=UPI003D7AEA46